MKIKKQVCKCFLVFSTDKYNDKKDQNNANTKANVK